jgi:glycosyltransferase involved in cell wall biosynthesis
MKIIIDCRMIDRSGIGTVIQELVPRLTSASHEFTLLGDPGILARYANPRTRIISFREPIYSVREQIRFPRRVLSNADVLLCPQYNIPLTAFPRIVVIVHDLAHLVLPRFFGGIGKRLYAHFFFRVALRRAQRIVTPSEFTRSEILQHLDVAPSSVVTILNGPGRSFPSGLDLSLDRVKPYGVDLPYILAVGNMKLHKNLETLLEAFLLVKQVSDLRLKLVLTGRDFGTRASRVPFPGWSPERLKAEGVVLTGHVSDEDMPALYSNASLYVTPSLYEGFGLTPLEALRFGTLPLVADAGALPEVVDDPELRFNPKEPRDLARKALACLHDPELLSKKLSEQEKRLKNFSWDSAAGAYLRLLETVGAEGKELGSNAAT